MIDNPRSHDLTRAPPSASAPACACAGCARACARRRRGRRRRRAGGRRRRGFRSVGARPARSARVAAARENRRRRDQRIVAAPQMRAHARPWPFAGRRAEPRGRRIEREIAHRVEHVRLVHRHAAEAALEQMAGDARAGVDEGGVAPVRLADRARQPVQRRRRQDEVHVIGDLKANAKHSSVGNRPSRKRRCSRSARR